MLVVLCCGGVVLVRGDPVCGVSLDGLWEWEGVGCVLTGVAWESWVCVLECCGPVKAGVCV